MDIPVKITLNEEIEPLLRAAERQANAEAFIREITEDKDRSTLNLESLISRGNLLGFNISTHLEALLRTKNTEKIKKVHEFLIEIQKWADGNLWKVVSALDVDEDTCSDCDDCHCDDVEEPILEEGTIYLKRSLIRQLAVLEAAWAKTHSDLIEELKTRGDTHCGKALHVHIELLERKIEMLSSKIREMV